MYEHHLKVMQPLCVIQFNSVRARDCQSRGHRGNLYENERNQKTKCEI